MSSTDGGEPGATATASPSVATAGPAIAMVNLKLPPFWSSDPEVWFQQVKAQFPMRHVTVQRTKFDHVVASLSPDFATEVRDLINRPPADAHNDSLREQLIKRTTASEQRKLQQLFSAEELGDRKPSQLLRRLQQRASTTDNTFLWEFFLKCLPGNVRMILASTASSSSFDELADQADKNNGCCHTVCLCFAAPTTTAQRRGRPVMHRGHSS